MLDRNFLAKGRAYAVFFLVYTGLFWLFTATLRYTFPFLAGFALAWFLQPVVRFLKQKLPLSEGCAAAVTTAALYVLLIGALFLLGMWLVGEINNLLHTIRDADLGRLTEPLNRLFLQAGEFLNHIDQDFIQENQRQLLNLAQAAASVLTSALTAALGFLTSLPAVLAMFLVMVVSTYFFKRHGKNSEALVQPALCAGKGNSP